jgi:hypothetical protein
VALEVGPTFAREVIQLASFGCFEIPAPREGLNNDAAWQHFF